jgi:hypothetical protein
MKDSATIPGATRALAVSPLAFTQLAAEQFISSWSDRTCSSSALTRVL